MSIGHTQMSIPPLDEQKCPLDIHMSIRPMDEQKCPFDIQMSIRPLGKQKCPVDIQMSIRPMDEQKCPVDIQMSIGHLAEVLDMYKKSKANLMFKILNGKAPTYLQDLFSVRGTGYNIRNSEMR